jgi:mannose-6-phosphate isomerase-like protein (cupin superfamily)
VDHGEQPSAVWAHELNGVATFADLRPAVQDVAAHIVQSAWYWVTEATPTVGSDDPRAAGQMPTSRVFPAPGGAKFGIVRFPARSDGRMPAAAASLSAGITHNDSSSGMHRTASLDFEVVLSGRIVLELPGGQSREFGPGDAIVVSGVPHRWHNPYDEPCVYAAVVLGAYDGSEDPSNG